MADRRGHFPPRLAPSCGHLSWVSPLLWPFYFNLLLIGLEARHPPRRPPGFEPLGMAILCYFCNSSFPAQSVIGRGHSRQHSASLNFGARGVLQFPCLRNQPMKMSKSEAPIYFSSKPSCPSPVSRSSALKSSRSVIAVVMMGPVYVHACAVASSREPPCTVCCSSWSFHHQASERCGRTWKRIPVSELSAYASGRQT